MHTIGIMAGDVDRAQHLRTELGLPGAYIVPNTASGGRGIRLDVLLIDETAMPLDEGTALRVGPMASVLYVLRRAASLHDVTDNCDGTVLARPGWAVPTGTTTTGHVQPSVR